MTQLQLRSFYDILKVVRLYLKYLQCDQSLGNLSDQKLESKQSQTESSPGQGATPIFIRSQHGISQYFSDRASTYSYKFDYVRVFYVTLLYGGIIIGTGFAIKVAAAAMKEIRNGTEVPTDDKNDEKTGENNEKTEEV